MKILPIGAEVFHMRTDGRTNRQTWRS